jgi:hypothetical protein
VRSARAAIALAAILGIGGCSTTQQEAARLRLNSARLRAGELSVRVSSPGHDVRVERLAIVHGARGQAAVVARLRNVSGRAVSDLPVSVGSIEPSGRRRYFDAAAGLDYFQTHLPGIRAGGARTWVYRLRPGIVTRHVFIAVGDPGTIRPSLPASLPDVLVRELGRTPRGIRIAVRNGSSVPQYQLTVFTVAARGGHYLAAGRSTLEHLGTGATSVLVIPMVGNYAGASAFVQAPPTIFR